MISATTKTDRPGTSLRCVSWNVHRAKGTDGRVDPARVRAAIGSDLAPWEGDVLALQEADEECRPHQRILDVAGIASDTGLTCQHDSEALRWGPQSDGFLGTIVFLHPRFSVAYRDVVDLPGHCHRGAVVVEAEADGIPFRLMSMHLSLSQPLRMVQMRIIGQYLHRRPEMQTVLLGDFNEWRPWGGLMLSARLLGRRFEGPARRSFPSGRPLLPLDRILTDRPGALRGVETVNTPRLRLASDHLPIRGIVGLAEAD